MFDINKLPIYVQAAAREIGLVANAFIRAECGRAWLDKHAPPDWRLQMMTIYAGNISSRINLHYGDQNPLALAFRRDKSLKGPDGRVLWGPVAERFGFNKNRKAAEDLGFMPKEHHVGSVVIDDNTDAYFLDDAWETVLGHLRWYPQPVAAYPETGELGKFFTFFDPNKSALLKMAGARHRDNDS